MENSRKVSEVTTPLVLAIVACLLLVSPRLGELAPLKARGNLSPEYHAYITGVVPLYDVHPQFRGYLAVLALVGLAGLMVRFGPELVTVHWAVPGLLRVAAVALFGWAIISPVTVTSIWHTKVLGASALLILLAVVSRWKWTIGGPARNVCDALLPWSEYPALLLAGLFLTYTLSLLCVSVYTLIWLPPGASQLGLMGAQGLHWLATPLRLAGVLPGPIAAEGTWLPRTITVSALAANVWLLVDIFRRHEQFRRHDQVWRYRASILRWSVVVTLLLIGVLMASGVSRAPSAMSSDLLFNVDLHLSVVLGAVAQLVDGYTWSHGVESVYGLLVPTVVAEFIGGRAYSFQCIATTVQVLQLLLCGLFVGASWMRWRDPRALLVLACLLTFYYPAGTGLLFPNHSAWRYLGVPVFLFGLARACRQGKLGSAFVKSLLSAIALLSNVETGFCLLIALIASELLREREAIRASSTVLGGSALAVALGGLLLLGGDADSLGCLSEFHRATGELGGERYVLIPAFALLLMHCSMVVLRSCESSVRNAQDQFDAVCALYCLGWATYFVHRPNGVYLLPVAVVYSLILPRLHQDVRRCLGGSRTYSVVFMWFAVFSLCGYVLSQLSNFADKLRTDTVDVERFMDMDTLSGVRSATRELIDELPPGAGYLAPFPFLIRAFGAPNNHLGTVNPFGILLDEEQQNFLEGSLPRTLLLPVASRIFSPGAPPGTYLRYLDRVGSVLDSRGYRRVGGLGYWTQYSVPAGAGT